ncbi:MAG: biopolymer transporter ExbD [Lentisphaeraceae bacterium]|nr:biopolymer transporter ExbD [Lentisphaeraceae bacterium]
MMKLLQIIFILSLFSCTSKQETKDAAFWRMKYEALDSFVKKKGLKTEADKAVKDYESAMSVYHFAVFKNYYSLNGTELESSQLKERISGLKGKKGQKINITAMHDASHQDLLKLMNELSLAGFTNFNLSSEKPEP